MRGPLCVARSTIPGNAKASKSRTGNDIGTTLFVYVTCCVGAGTVLFSNLK